MAQIPIEERKRHSGGSNIWKWLLALVVVGLLVWLVASLVDTGPEDDLAALDDSDQIETLDGDTYDEDGAIGTREQGQMDDDVMSQPTTGPVNSIATLENGTSPQQMAGADVQLTDVRIERVLSDGAFLVSATTQSATPDEQMGMEQDRMTDSEMGMERRMDSGQMDRQPTQTDHTALIVVDGMQQSMDDIAEGQHISMLGGTVMMADAAAMEERAIESEEAMDDGYFILAEQLDVAQRSS